jgi:hypothetical protein
MRQAPGIKKIYINPTEGATVTCESCGRSRKFTISVFPPEAKRAKVRCVCGVTYEVAIERRRADRKQTYLIGNYAKVGSLTVSGKMVVENLSLYGVGFRTESKRDIKVNDTIKVDFYLDRGNESNIFRIDDQSRTKVVKYVTVRWTDYNYLGAEFNDPSAYATELKQFLDQL